MHQQELNQEFLLFSIKLSVKPVSPNITPTALFEYLGVLCFSSVFPLSWEIWTAFEYIMIQFNAAYSHDYSLFWETVSFGLSKWLQRVYCNIFWIILLCCSKLSANQQREHWETRSFHIRNFLPVTEGARNFPQIQICSSGRSIILVNEKTWGLSSGTSGNLVSCLSFLGVPRAIEEGSLTPVPPWVSVSPVFSNPRCTDPVNWGGWRWSDQERKRKFLLLQCPLANSISPRVNTGLHSGLPSLTLLCSVGTLSWNWWTTESQFLQL